MHEIAIVDLCRLRTGCAALVWVRWANRGVEQALGRPLVHRGNGGTSIDAEALTLVALAEQLELGMRSLGEDGPRYVVLDASARDVHIEVQRVEHESRVHLDIETDDQAAEVARLETATAEDAAQRAQTDAFRAVVYVENLFDAKYFANAYEKAFYSGVQVEPSYRSFGVSVGYKF